MEIANINDYNIGNITQYISSNYLLLDDTTKRVFVSGMGLDIF